MDSALLEPMVVILATIVSPLVVGLLAVLFDRKEPRPGIWAEYILGVVLIGILLLASPNAWLGLLSEHERENRVILSNANLIFGPWLGAVLTITVGIIGGSIGASRHRQRRREIAATNLSKTLQAQNAATKS
ncbi:hypothetical protein [Leifsonia sp. A12D58]|uniref:hypothetical protein n=1 Tax=Leifsonia sp. A12D58 TaxID=3397674 RepID=UPI0039DFF8A4